MLTPLHQAVGTNLGHRCAGHLYQRLMVVCGAPPGIAHLEDAGLAEEQAVARDFDLGLTGPPIYISMDFIAAGLSLLLTGIAATVVTVGFAWWAPIVLGLGWGSTHWLLHESGVWKDRNTDEVRSAQRHADYAYRLAVDPPAAKELRVFGLGDWVVDRFAGRRRLLHDLQYRATRVRERSMATCLAIVAAANALVFWRIAEAAIDGRIGLGAAAVYFQAALGASAIAFGELSWALDGAAAPVAALARLEQEMPAIGALASGDGDASGMPAGEIRFRDVHFSYGDGSGPPVLDGLELTIPAGTSLAIVGVNGAGKTTIAKLLCRFHDPTGGAIEIDGVDLRTLDVDSWRRRVTAVFQDFVRYERSLADNVAPGGGSTEAIRGALADAGGGSLAELDTILSRAYPGGTDLSGGQWQRVALARALCAVRLGAGLVLLDEPTAQLDVRGEAEIFERVLAATRHCTTILISHRFSTVRHADRICVVEHGRVIEHGSHDELIALGGRYRTMYELQAARFADPGADDADDGEEVLDDPAA